MQALREYETIYILKPDIADDAMANVQDRLSERIQRTVEKASRNERANQWS